MLVYSMVVQSQQEGPPFESHWGRALLCMFSQCLCGFPLGTPGFPHHQNMHKQVDIQVSTLDQRHWLRSRVRLRVNPCPVLSQDGLKPHTILTSFTVLYSV